MHKGAAKAILEDAKEQGQEVPYRLLWHHLKGSEEADEIWENTSLAAQAALGGGSYAHATTILVHAFSLPKYEEQAGYLDHLLFHGCEAHGARDEDEETREGAQTTQRVEESERNAATVDPHPPRPASARRWKPRGRASQVTPPSLAGGASTPASDSVEFRSQGGDAPREGSTTPHLGVMCVEVPQRSGGAAPSLAFHTDFTDLILQSL